MSVRSLLLIALCSAHAAAAPSTRAALVLASPGPDDARLAAVRSHLSAHYQLIDAAAVRETLEHFRRDPGPEERVREALGRAHQKLRKFDLSALSRALGEAREAAAGLPPTIEGRALYAEVSVREAEAAALAGDSAASAHHMRVALSADPSLTLDPARHPPALVELCTRARAELTAAPETGMGVATVPPGVRVFTAGAWRGETPLVLSGLKAGPQVMWFVRDGYRSKAVQRDTEQLVPTPHPPGSGPTGDLPIMLESLDDSARLQPLVDAVRRTTGEGRRQAALALAAALEVAVVAVLDAGDMPVEYRRETLRALETPLTPRKWYQRGWVWGVVASGVIVVAVVAGVAGYYGQKEELSVSCCR